MLGEYNKSAGAGPELGSAFGNQKRMNDRPLVNCIWVLPEKADTDINNPRCPIKWAYIQRVLDNATKNPEADFRLWVDSKLLDDYSRFCLDLFMSQRAPPNVKLHDLQEIRDYRENACFKVPERGEEGYLRSQFNSRTGANNVYARADCARILVLDHCMQTEPERKHIIYSDADFFINLKAALESIKKYGIAFYQFETKTPTGHKASNGFMGFATDNADVRREFVSLKKDSLDAARQYRLSYQQFHNFLERLLPASLWSEVSLKDEIPRIGTKLPEVGFRPSFEQIKDWQVAQANKQQAALAVTA